MDDSKELEYKKYASKMDCTSYDQDHCNVEKMGCDGCGHNLDNSTDERK